MKIKLNRSGFTLIEVMFSMAIIGFCTLAVLSAISFGTFQIRMSTDNLKCSQILLEKTETIRLTSWDQLLTVGFIPSNWSVTNDNVIFSGTTVISPYPYVTAYSANMRMVTFNVNWNTGVISRNRNMVTYVALNGLQSYFF